MTVIVKKMKLELFKNDSTNVLLSSRVKSEIYLGPVFFVY